MEALYQLFISACQILAGVSLLAAMWAFYYAWGKEDEDVKFLGWRFLIIAATGGLFGGVSYLCLHFPDLPEWTGIALFAAPLLFICCLWALVLRGFIIINESGKHGLMKMK